MNGDFLGFTFIINGTEHKSQDLGIIRVSDGDRYKDQLIPEIEDKTIEIPGLDGSYLYGSDFKPRNFSISIAFDSMTEEQLRKMRAVFGYKQTGLLIFDEAPYKAYRVKVATPPELNYVCFDERARFEGAQRDGVRRIDDNWEQVTPWNYSNNTMRIYKGDGTIEFVAYYPFAMSVHKTLDEYDCDNIDEWANASKLKPNLEEFLQEFDNFQPTQDAEEGIGTIKVYNPGDIETGFDLFVPFPENENSTYIQLTDGTAALNVGSEANPVIKQGDDIGFQIDTTNQLVRGVEEVEVIGVETTTERRFSSHLYNNYVTGSFFKIQPSTETQILGVNTPSYDGLEINYKYLYF